ncbi:coenzyme F420-0:L-glutamate ligase [Clostridium paraputrificum]|uniref:coenzyme F420-0:L-glutamate ligase n=1 Tax=Clostridium TaxID=1485 RepID=UPI003D34B020
MRAIGTSATGVRAPIIKEGDDLNKIVVDSVLTAVESENIKLRDGDIVGITESLVARAQGNYAKLIDIAEDINRKYEGDIAVMFPILSRNRFASILKAISLTGKKIYLFLNYPSDEVGNHLMDIEMMDNSGVNPYTDHLTEEKYREVFGQEVKHPFTGIDYVQMYKELVGEENIEVHLTNDPRVALQYTKEILVCNIHERFRTKKVLEMAGAKTVLSLDEILTESVNGSGYNERYGLLGSNMATDESIKLFPRNSKELILNIQKSLKEKTGANMEVMVYGDGAFKDPVGKIWELADPVVSPYFTDGLIGTPDEIKIKYIADNDLTDDASREEQIKAKIKAKKDRKAIGNEALGTTPRQLTDLLGSLCDLISGSGDKGTPIVLIQGYFDNYATE